ncbi:hypothetical protein N646_4416 [Vibrio alginolyticus NBRC 15630 = ATCC 17749]|uniref:Uncharacterized protein n=1 Tax=Vibrio alginolyticus (strain ATCC 17749 / DSM 2171 / NBRC 15630 / NCIMB 1903 / NCTC 12160 / XII-53) TaxID=1219076 RepID=A0A2I3CSH4_VIBAX|nr:hypothetical protein N646_4416 [Vibrio alginolyticus NBRC 15630 = ATCC 17749]
METSPLLLVLKTRELKFFHPYISTIAVWNISTIAVWI